MALAPALGAPCHTSSSGSGPQLSSRSLWPGHPLPLSPFVSWLAGPSTSLPDAGLPDGAVLEVGSPVTPGSIPSPGAQDAGQLPPLMQQCKARGREYNPSMKKRVSKHGLQKRLSTPQGRATLLRRIAKGRWRLTVDAFV